MIPAISQTEEHHPCFFAESRGKYGRIHLPVARSCNIVCAYCRRDYDCANENRPGVSKGVITPKAALHRLAATLKSMPHIRVAGIAGPGDAFCQPELTLETFERIRRSFPDISFCVSSNGLNMRPYIQDLYGLGVRFVTITVNAIDPGIGSILVKKVEHNGIPYTGKTAAALLIRQQMDTIEQLKTLGFTVKVNSVVIPGINDDHSLFIARQMGRMGVDRMNLIPLIPLQGTEMARVSPPSPKQIRQLRESARRYLPQMYHCRRCRSDAAGCL